MNNNRGFTLLEVLLSIIILGVLITCFFQFFIFSQNTTTNNEDKLVSINIAQKVLEQIKQDAVNNGTTPSGQYWEITHPVDSNKSVYGPYIENTDDVQYKVTVNVGSPLANGLQMVTVTVEGKNNVSRCSVKGLVKL